jgi:hypothetical protein
MKIDSFFPEFFGKWCFIRKELINCQDAKFYPETVSHEQKREIDVRINDLIKEAENILEKKLKK